MLLYLHLPGNFTSLIIVPEISFMELLRTVGVAEINQHARFILEAPLDELEFNFALTGFFVVNDIPEKVVIIKTGV